MTNLIGRKIEVGERLRGLPAHEWNRHVDAANWIAQYGSNGTVTDLPIARRTVELEVKNVTGANQSRFSVLGINGYLFDPSQQQRGWESGDRVVQGVVPQASHADNFVILNESIENGKTAKCYAAGICQGRVLMNDLMDTFAHVIPGNTNNLTSKNEAGGCRILAKENVPAGNIARCLLRYAWTGGMEIVGFQLTENMSGGSAQGNVLTLDGMTTGQTADFLDPFDIFESLTSGLRGFAVKDDDQYTVIQAECPPPTQNVMIYAGEWAPATHSQRIGNPLTTGAYQKNEVVTDWPWLMIANTDTSDRPAPQPAGPPYWYAHGDNPAWNVPVAPNVSSILTGQRYTWNADGFLTGIRFWLPLADGTVNYTGMVIEGPTSPTPRSTIIFNDLVPTATGWISFPVYLPTAVGTVEDVYLFTNAVAQGSVFSATWDQKNSNGNPSSGEVYHRNNLTQMVFHHIDKNDNNQQSNLEAVSIGAEISAGGQIWTVVSKSNGASFVTYTVEPAYRLTEGERVYQFSSLSTLPIPTVNIPNFYLADPDTQGLYSETGIENAVLDENAYGIDMEVTPALVSPDWDFLAQSQ